MAQSQTAISRFERNTVSFDEKDSRSDDMNESIQEWIDDLIDETKDAQSSDRFQNWLEAQAAFHDYSYRNTLLILRQMPDATKVAGFWTWQNEFDRSVKEGESAIWIWSPIITEKCPECGNAESYHNNIDCEYDEIPPEEWDEGLVGFRPSPVFDVSQTEGEPLPELPTGLEQDVSDLQAPVVAAADQLGVDVEIVPKADWDRQASGFCRYDDDGPTVRVQQQNEAETAMTTIHEYAHALLHADRGNLDERPDRELEAEAVAYVVGRKFGLDMERSSFYLASWADDEPETIRERLNRISNAAQEIIEAVDH